MSITIPDCFCMAESSRVFQIHRRGLQNPRFSHSLHTTSTKGLPHPRTDQIRTGAPRRCKASLITDSDAFEVGRFVGSYGFMNITSYSGLQSGLEYASEDIGKLRIQDVGEGSVKIRLYEGRIAHGPLKGTSIIFKVYPGQRVGSLEADMMAANELRAHAFLQSCSKDLCQNLQILLGGFETKSGEQWLAFRNDGRYSAADYAKIAGEKMTNNRAPGEQRFWNPFQEEQTIKRRRHFVIKLLQGIMNGLVYMHDHDRLHQSLGPASVVLNTIAEKDADYLIPRLRDLAFSVDIGYSSLEEGPGTLAEGLWRRAAAAGAFNPIQKKAFGIADDIYEAGLLFHTWLLFPFVNQASWIAFLYKNSHSCICSMKLQRLLESTFQLDLQATREYCLADDRLLEAVKFLDLGDGAGWELLQAMLNPDFSKRPIAASVLNHRFMTVALL